MAHEITTNPLRGVELARDGVHYGIYDHGAHAWAWQPEHEQPVLWTSGASDFADGKPIRGGVPVCFPWFGPGRSGDLEPGHGFARLADWRLVDASDTEGGLVVEYHLDETITGEQPNWPHRYDARLRATFLARNFEIELTVTNTGDEEFSYEEALHTYLNVGDVRHVRVTGLEGARYFDKVAGDWADQVGEVTIASETDRVYLSTDDVLVDDPTLGRKLVIGKTGSANTVVWNPWVAKSAAMPDFGEDEWTGMLCIEAANALDDAITLQPGGSHTIAQRISLMG
jgi:glucose-6-phosphate 1-epimerase